MSTTALEIISLNRTVFSGAIISVTVPGIEGELTILANHIPLTTPLKAGELIVREEKGEHYFAVSGGFLLVQAKKITVMADSAEHLDELDEEKIKAAKLNAEKLLSEKQFADDREFADASGLLERSLAGLKVLRRRRKH